MLRYSFAVLLPMLYIIYAHLSHKLFILKGIQKFIYQYLENELLQSTTSIAFILI